MKGIVSMTVFVISHIMLWGQNHISISGPCTETMVQTAKGKWINRLDNMGNITPSQKLEAGKRLDILHNILLTMYHDPTGVDVRVNRSAGICYYGATRKYRFTEDDRVTFDYVKLLPIKTYSYFANFSPHYCAHTDKGIVFMPGVSNENNDGLGITINDFAGIAGDPASDDDWLINGLPVRKLNTKVNENWKGYEVYGDVRLRGRAILIHREGMLPYIPVTRKQYLDRCLVVTAKLWDKIIEFAKMTPVRSLEEQETEKKAKLAKFEKDFGKDPGRLQSAVDYYLSGYKTDQEIRDEQVDRAIKNKEAELKKFTDEVEKSTSEGLLDEPAFIRVLYISDFIFDTDPQSGFMLVTDNPGYIRKDLPDHVPQFMVLSWKWSEYPPHKEYEKMFLMDFPVEKLQAMIR